MNAFIWKSPILRKIKRKIRCVANCFNIRVPTFTETQEDSSFKREFNEFKIAAEKHDQRFELKWEDRYPCLGDRTSTTTFSKEYLYHLSWAARVLSRTKPDLHIDISSHVYFVGVLSAFVRTKFYEYRLPNIRLTNLECEAGDLTGLPFENESIYSLSCLHVVEHIGLGRYGDRIDYEGDLKAIAELKRVLAIGGDLLVVVPVGRPRIEFNAHRVYSYEQIMNYFDGMGLVEFAYIPQQDDHGYLIIGADPIIVSQYDYGCGCFWFRKCDRGFLR